MLTMQASVSPNPTPWAPNLRETHHTGRAICEVYTYKAQRHTPKGKSETSACLLYLSTDSCLQLEQRMRMEARGVTHERPETHEPTDSHEYMAAMNTRIHGLA